MPILKNTRKLRSGWVHEVTVACEAVDVPEDILDADLIEDIVSAANDLPPMSDDDAIRALYAKFAARECCQSHLAVLYSTKKPRVCDLIHNPLMGKRPAGRERILSETEEMAVLQYVADCQEGFNCVEPKDLTQFIRKMIEESPFQDRVISDTFVYKNKIFTEKLALEAPIRIEEVRLKACTYDKFEKFFDDLRVLFEAHTYDPDLIINVDETTASAAETKRTKTVFRVKGLDLPVVSAKMPLEEHITLTCAVSASGKALDPTFILSNKCVTAEDKMYGKHFNFGPYNLTHSASGWQDNVNIHRLTMYYNFAFIRIHSYLQKTFLKWLKKSLIPFREELKKQDKPILLILDGHKTHCAEAAHSFCASNNIHLCFLPPHSTHVLQPLDVGVFNLYKAEYRGNYGKQKVAFLDTIKDEETKKQLPEATKKRCKILGRAISAHKLRVIDVVITKAFEKTGIYPLSFSEFISNAVGVSGVPPNEIAAAKALEKTEHQRLSKLMLGKRKNMERDEDYYKVPMVET